MGERLAYLPSAGFCLLAALLWLRLENYQRRLAWAVLAIVVVALAARTVVRNHDWRDNFSLFSAGARAVPGSAKMHFALGGEYMNRGQLQAALPGIADRPPHLIRTIPRPWNSAGLWNPSWAMIRRLAVFLRKGLSMTPRDNPGYDFRAVNLAAQLMKLGENDAALKLLNEEIANSPGYSRAWSNRAVIRYRRGEFTSARDDAQNALRLDPENGQAQNLLNLLRAPAPFAPQR